MSDSEIDAIRAKEEQSLEKVSQRFREDSYVTRIRKMVKGFACPRDTKEYKAARIEAQRLAAPCCAVFIPLFFAVLLVILATGSTSPDEAKYPTFEKRPPPVPPVLVPPTPVETGRSSGGSEEAVVTSVGMDIPFEMPLMPGLSPITLPPAGLPDVLRIKNPLRLRGPYETRTGDFRDAIIAEESGDPRSEQAVIAALRWLKKNQQTDGAWPKNAVAMTGLATLTFLAHGETPGARSPEFGETVRLALDYLVRSQGPDGRISGSYAHAIAAYALCEAYGMTLNPSVKEAADKAVQVLVIGQNPAGGWDYGLEPCERDDTSVMGWCAQALKAAHLADAYHDRPALQAAMKKAVKGFQKNSQPGGGFGYTGPGAGGLSSVGTLCLQLLGAAGSPQVRNTLALMEAWQPALLAENGIGGSTQYYYYYATQAKFHGGGKGWKAWNAMMWPLYLGAQKIEKNAIADADGKLQDVGWWENSDVHSDRPVMDTCLAALQLMVYYRNRLSTTQAAAATDDQGVAEAPVTATLGKDDIPVPLGNL